MRQSYPYYAAEVTSASGGVALFLDEPRCPNGTSYCALCGYCMSVCTIEMCFALSSQDAP